MATNKVIQLRRERYEKPSHNTLPVSGTSFAPVRETSTSLQRDPQKTPAGQLLLQLNLLAQSIEQDVKNLTGNYPPHSDR